MPAQSQRQADAERAVRRGELKEALSILRQMLAESPGDAQVQVRIAAIESLVQPRELSEARAVPVAPSIDFTRPPTLEQTAEMLLERGDVAGAIATYQRVLKDRPDHELARERCRELEDLHAVIPRSPAVPTLPESKPELFEALLARIAARRK
jgi:tetratricopeptide (TPR) repeat protein